MKNIDELQSIIGFVPENKELFQLALTHSSYNSTANTKHHDYERLEYIGDAVINFVCADLIYKLHPNMEPGNMSKMRSKLVDSKALSSYARNVKLSDFIIAGNSISSDQINANNHILEDIFEALTGAIYETKGMDFAYNYVKGYLYDLIINFNFDKLTDYKSKLQEEMQAEGRNVHYELVSQTGPAHSPIFSVQVMYENISLATGTGKTKKAAEEDAARKALEKRSTY